MATSASAPFEADDEAFGAVIRSKLDWMPVGFAGNTDCHGGRE